MQVINKVQLTEIVGKIRTKQESVHARNALILPAFEFTELTKRFSRLMKSSACLTGGRIAGIIKNLHSRSTPNLDSVYTL